MLVLQACSTPVFRSGRMGLFDRNGDSGSSTRRTEPSYRNIASSEESLRLSGNWQWPLNQVSVSSDFGQRGRKFHQGIDLRASIGTPVLAASDGEVIYVGNRIRGYGRMVVLKHADNIFTVYAHNSKNLVRSGQVVKGGQVIAKAGRSGRASGPHLHFEIRQGTLSYNPASVFQNYFARRSGEKSNRKVATSKSGNSRNSSRRL